MLYNIIFGPGRTRAKKTFLRPNPYKKQVLNFIQIHFSSFIFCSNIFIFQIDLQIWTIDPTYNQDRIEKKKFYRYIVKKKCNKAKESKKIMGR